MPTRSQQYEVISVSVPRDLVKRANALIPRAKRSRIISRVLATFLDRIATKRLEQEYVAYYTNRPARELQDERDLLAAWDLSDSEAWAILEREESGGRRASR